MAANDRNKPKRQASSHSTYSLMEFMREYPDDAACLDRLWRERFAPDGHHAACPKCKRERKFHRVSTRACYACDSCGWQIYPTKGTIFQKSTTSLQLWFYAMYIMASTRCGISAKQLERELGVTYKTAWRMFNKIRNELMGDDGEPLDGDVEIDETSWGGRPRRKLGSYSEVAKFREAKPTIVGMVERGGKVRLRVIPSRRGPALSREVRANVHPSAIIFTDDWQAYKPLRSEFLRPPDHQSLGWRLRRGRYAYERDRGLLREPEDRDARCLQEGLAPLASVLLGTNTPSATTTATAKRYSSSYLLGRQASKRNTARAMSQENVEIVRASIDALNRGDWDAVLSYAAPNCRYDTTRELNEWRGVYETPERVRRALEGFYGMWESWRIEIDELVEVGEDTVVTRGTGYLRGREDIEVTARNNYVWTFRNGALTELTSYPEWKVALEAAGLRE